MSAGHHDRRSYADTLIKVHHILVVHADAARGDEATDRVWSIGAVDRIFAARKRQGSNPHWIAWRSSGDHPRNVGRTCPSGLDVLAVDVRFAGPLHTRLANPDRIAQRSTISHHVIKLPLACFYHDGADRNLGWKGDGLPRFGRSRFNGRRKQDSARVGWCCSAETC